MANRFSPPPTLSGAAEQLFPYLYTLSEQLNLLSEECSCTRLWSDTSQAVSAPSSIGGQDGAYNAVKSLVIKTAETAVRESDSLRTALTGSYLAKSDFGSYFENARVTIGGTAYGIEQLYNYSAALDSAFGDFRTDVRAYIKSGLLYYNGAVPVYGVGLGNIYSATACYGLTSDSAADMSKTYYALTDGVYSAFDISPGDNPAQLGLYEAVISRSGNLYSTFTADEIAFWYGSAKQAYINSSAAYFPSAVITGGSLNINGKFTVSQQGVLTASDANISGSVTASSLVIAEGAEVAGLNAGHITAGTLSADRISGGTLDCSSITVSGLSAESITSGTLDCTSITVSGLSAAAIASGELDSTHIRLGGSMYVYHDDFVTNGGAFGYFPSFHGALSCAGIGIQAAPYGGGGQLSCSDSGAKLWFPNAEVYLDSSGVNISGIFNRISYGSSVPQPVQECVSGTVSSAWSDIGFSCAPPSAAVVASVNYDGGNYSSSYTVKVRCDGDVWQWCLAGSSGTATAAAIAAW